MSAPVPPDLAREWRRKLAESGFQDIESPLRERITGDALYHERPVAAEVAYWTRAAEFLRVHEFRDELDLRIWTVHVELQAGERITAREVFRSESGGARRKVARVLGRLRAEMEQREQPRRGRPPNPEGRDRGSLVASARFSEHEAAALFLLVDRWGVRRQDALLRAVQIVAKLVADGVCVNTNTGGQGANR